MLQPVEHTVPYTTIHPKTLTYGIIVNGIPMAYLGEDLDKITEIYDNINGTNIKITRNKDSSIDFFNLDTNKVIQKDHSYFFAWYAFNPKTDVWEP